MSLDVLNDKQISQALNNLYNIIPSYKQHYFYNCSLVDPYLLASFGLQISKKRITPASETGETLSINTAVCVNSNCDLTIDFDTNEDLDQKQPLDTLVRQHDAECSYSKVKEQLISFNMFRRLGKQIFFQNVKILQERKVWIQLDPKDILGLIEENKCQEQSKINLMLEQLRQLDSNIFGEVLTKITSSVFLALLGWNWGEKNVLLCHFCGASRDVTQFISPLECTLLKMREGFPLVRAHQSWCCLIAPQQEYWQQILRQSAISQLENVEGQVSRSLVELECKSIQRQTFEVYLQHIGKVNTLKRQLHIKRESVNTKYSEKQDLRKYLGDHLQNLQQLIEQSKEAEQKVVKGLVLLE